MTIEKSVLGKISSAEFGMYPDRPFMFGLQLRFSIDGGRSGIGDGLWNTVNISKTLEWDEEGERERVFMDRLEKLEEILKAAKVNHVSELVGKPVEVFLVGNTYKDFRILTEVL